MKRNVSLKKIKLYLLRGNKSFISYLNTNGFTKQYASIYRDKMGEKYLSGIIYVFSKESAVPSWRAHLKEMQKPKTRDIKLAKNQDERAVVFLKIEITNSEGNTTPKTFVLTFGGGHHLLKPEFIVKDFATRISRLFIKPEKVTLIDSVTIENNTFHTRKSSSKNLPQNKLLLRGELSLIKKIHGRSKLHKFINIKDHKKDLILGGESGLDLTGNFNLRKDLVDLIEILGTEYFSKKDTEFNINELLYPVKDVTTKDKLDKLLEKKLEKIVVNSTTLDYRNIRGIDIQPPSQIGYEDFTGVFITGLWYKDRDSTGDTEINVLDFFERLRLLHITKGKFNTGLEIVNKLKSCFIEIKMDSQETGVKEKLRLSSIFESLIMEIVIGSSKYLLFSGKWFEVNYEFYSKLKLEIDSLPQHPSISPLINYPKYGNRAEGEYNNDLSTSNSLLLMDQKDYRFNKTKIKTNSLNARSTLEVCDVLRFSDTDIEFIHVKRKSNASGTSHLVAQAVSSATTFNEIQNDIITHINKLIPASQTKLDWKNQTRHVSLVILNEKYTSSSKASSLLSILEILTIVQNVYTLRELGYQVYLKIVR